MKRLRLLNQILKTTNLKPIVGSFLVCFLFIAFLLYLIEPQFHSYAQSLWYCFSSTTTIGYGDIVAQTSIGRILSVILTLYGILILAFIPGVIVSYFTEFNKIKSKESVAAFLDCLEHLEEKSYEELKELSDKIKEKRYQI